MIVDHPDVLTKVSGVERSVIVENPVVIGGTKAGHIAEIVHRAIVPDVPGSGLNVRNLSKIVELTQVQELAKIAYFPGIIQLAAIDQGAEVFIVIEFIAPIPAVHVVSGVGWVRIRRHLLARDCGPRNVEVGKVRTGYANENHKTNG